MIENTTQQFIENLAHREGVPIEKIREIVIQSFRNSYYRGENTAADLHFEFNADLVVYRRYQIVEHVNNPEKEIAHNDPLLKKEQVREGVFFLPLDIKNLSFSLNQEIKKQLRNYLGEIN